MFPLKKAIIKFSVKHGENFILSPSSTILYPDFFEVGNDVFINMNFYCSTLEGVKIEDRVMFGSNCSILGGDHSYDEIEASLRFPSKLGKNNPLEIEKDSWIGHGTIILKGGHVSEGTIIGAGSIVNKNTLPYSIYAGVPAKFIKYRFKSYLELKKHLDFMETKYNSRSRYSTDFLKKLYL